MIRTTEKHIYVKGEPDQYYLSVMHPEFPTFRLHTPDTCIVICSTFYEHCNYKMLPKNSFVIALDYIEYCAIIEQWGSGLMYKDYKDFWHIDSVLKKLQDQYKQYTANINPFTFKTSEHEQ